MPGVAVKAFDIAGGIQLAGGQNWFLVDGQPVVLVGDPVAGHGLFQHAGPVMATGSSFFQINGVPACRAGDMATCGHASTGRGWFSTD